MELLFIKIVRILFALFLVYTVIYLVQMGISLCIAVYELAEYRKKQTIGPQIVTDETAVQQPVSVIIPTYNEADCILSTIDSLLQEDYPGLEIVVVNDGSKDDTERILIEHYNLQKGKLRFYGELKTKKVLQSYHGRCADKRLTLICKENGGKADALNCGLNICRSSLCVVLDADTKVGPGSIRILAGRFLMDDRTVVCAGAVASEKLEEYPRLNVFRKTLVLFQTLEYYRTFYMQRVMFGRRNANTIVSGAFAMFDTELMRKIGGYQVNTIGEDMELTMRIHAFCASQQKQYQIAYAPEAKCITQLPFTFTDFYHQRRRWQIGMLQSMRLHSYMLGSWHYGWVGIVAGTFFVVYELLGPFLELLGLATLVAANLLGILNVGFTIKAMLAYALAIILMQMVLVNAIDTYEVECLGIRRRLALMVISVLEIVFFHPLNVFIKIAASLTSYRNRKRWEHIRRIRTK